MSNDAGSNDDDTSAADAAATGKAPEGSKDADLREGEKSGRDRRRHARVDLPVLVQIRYTATEAARTVYAVNISQSGLFLDVDDGKPVGSRVFVQVTTTDGKHLLRGEGRVVRRPHIASSATEPGQQGGCGVELTGFDAAARAILQKLVDDAGG